jgi:hypothetical protein
VKEDMIITAQSFKRAAVYLKSNLKETRLDKMKYEWSAIIANYAFSCELFLKAILEDISNSKRGHDLQKLFKCLPENKQNDIKDKCLSKVSEMFGDDLTFDKHMDLISSNFEVFRYSYEKDNKILTTDLNFLAVFSNVLEEETQSIVKTNSTN